MTRTPRLWFTLAVALGLVGCAATRPAPSDDALWRDLTGLCGKAYPGTVVEAPAEDTTFTGRTMVMHVRTCGDSAIRIPFHVGSNRSGTWVLIRTASGLRLKHEHRREDGSEDPITQYGGDLRRPHPPGLYEFPADSFTARLMPAARSNVWTVALEPGVRFVYSMRREGTDRRFRFEFDLAKPTAVPPPPWGATAE
jgi:hypothetical protein